MSRLYGSNMLGQVLCDVAHKCLAEGRGSVRLISGSTITAADRKRITGGVVVGMYNGRPEDTVYLQPFSTVDEAMNHIDSLPPNQRAEHIQMIRVSRGNGYPYAIESHGRNVIVI